MLIYLRLLTKKQLFILGTIFSLALFSFLMLRCVNKISIDTSAQAIKPLPRVLIDPGHGGEDGGAVVEDTLEKNINLPISQDTGDLLRLLGFEVQLTRTEDTGLSDEGKNVKQRKINDMKKRLKLYDSCDNNVILSIHQNKFSDTSSNGTQVFYSPNHSQSKMLADCIQHAVQSGLQPQNQRLPKKAGKNIYLLSNTKQPAVIVECGFLSNKKERRMLLDDAYQRELAFIITTGFLDFQNTV